MTLLIYQVAALIHSCLICMSEKLVSLISEEKSCDKSCCSATINFKMVVDLTDICAHVNSTISQFRRATQL